MTPNYVDSSPTGIVVSPWCSCRGSGNMEEECEKFLRDFTENPCLRKSHQSLPEILTSHRGPTSGGPMASMGLPQQPAETLGFVFLETHATEWSVGQPQFTTGDLEPMSGQGQNFLACCPDSFSQVPAVTCPFKDPFPFRIGDFLFKSSDCYSKGYRES